MPHEVERLFDAAEHHGLRVKLHAEQLSNRGGAALAARFNALSADHLEHLDEAGVAAMADAGTVAVLLPGAFYALQETRKPPVQLLRDHGVPIAVATDCNPGTSPLLSPTLAMNMACTLFGLTPEEALAGMTVNAARALGLEERNRQHRARQGRRPRCVAGRKPGRARLLDRPSGPRTPDFRGRGQRDRPARQQPPHPRPPRQRDRRQELGDRSRRADADEQPRRRGRRGPAEPGRLRRHRPRRAQLGLLRHASSRRSSGSRTTRPCSSSRASRSASSAPTPTRRAC